MKKKTLLLVTLATLGLTASTMAQNLPNYVPADGLVGWWPFNGNANDESGNDLNGTVNGAILTNDRFENNNSAYSFDGFDDLIEISDASSLRCRKITLSAWVLKNSTAIGQIIYKGNLSDAQSEAYSLNGNVLFGIKINSNCIAGEGWITTNYNQTLEPAQWHHLVSTFDGDTIKNYYDGIYLVSNNYSGLIDSCLNSNLRFGYNHTLNNNGNPWNGKIDDIGIWNRALTQQEITVLYNGNSGITGFNSVTHNNIIKIFPNPANEHVTIDYGNFATVNGYQLKIQNSIGQQVFQTNINQQVDYLSLSNLGGNGLYFVHIIDAQGNTIVIRKIVLQ